MKILLIGANSYVGARLFYDLRSSFQIIGTYHKEQFFHEFFQLDITSRESLSNIFSNIKPDIVIHAANYPSPSNAVNNEEAFRSLNDKGTQNVVEFSNKFGSKLIFISSQAANNPSNLYGELKLKSEMLAKQVTNGYLILRPSYIVGFSPNTSNPRPFNKILKCIDDPKTIAEFDISWKLQPTYLGHLSAVIKWIINTDNWNQEVPVFIDELVTQYQIASDILSSFEIEVNKIDLGINIPPSRDSLDFFNSMQLPPRTYAEMIEIVVSEIRNRDKFRL